jgi:hypothetical protein
LNPKKQCLTKPYVKPSTTATATITADPKRRNKPASSSLSTNSTTFFEDLFASYQVSLRNGRAAVE